MTYGNWGAFVYCNGQRRKDKEDAYLFKEIDNDVFLSHGVLGDGKIRVQLYKNDIPNINVYKYKKIRAIDWDECKMIKDEISEFQNVYDIEFVYKKYKFHFYNNGDNTIAEMIDDKGNKWKGESGFEFGAGYEDKEKHRKKTHIRLYDILKIKKRKLFFRNKY